MKGFGLIVVLAALLTITYLIVRDLDTLHSRSGDRVVLEPVEAAKGTVDLLNRTQDERRQRIDEAK
jgi:hypothetical protein